MDNLQHLKSFKSFTNNHGKTTFWNPNTAFHMGAAVKVVNSHPEHAEKEGVIAGVGKEKGMLIIKLKDNKKITIAKDQLLAI